MHTLDSSQKNANSVENDILRGRMFTTEEKINAKNRLQNYRFWNDCCRNDRLHWVQIFTFRLDFLHFDPTNSWISFIFICLFFYFYLFLFFYLLIYLHLVFVFIYFFIYFYFSIYLIFLFKFFFIYLFKQKVIIFKISSETIKPLTIHYFTRRKKPKENSK